MSGRNLSPEALRNQADYSESIGDLYVPLTPADARALADLIERLWAAINAAEGDA